MRAIVVNSIGRLEDLAIEERPSPTPGPGEVAVAVAAAAVNFPDLLVIEGKYQVRPPPPFIPGKECAGTVTAVGEGVTGRKPGDRVLVELEYGAFAEEIAPPADHCYPMPDGIGFDEAAAIGIAFQTAHFALVDRARVQAGETVLVTGATGGVGIAAMQLAKAFGCTVIAGVTTMSKAAIARENGADHIIDLSGGELREAIPGQVRAIAGGGVDVVVEIVGGEAFDGCIRCVNFRGRLIVVGFTSGAIPTLNANYALLKNIGVIGLDWSKYRDREPAWVGRVQAEIFDLHAAGKLHMPVQATFPMDRFVDAFDIIRRRRVRGKVVLRMGGAG